MKNKTHDWDRKGDNQEPLTADSPATDYSYNAVKSGLPAANVLRSVLFYSQAPLLVAFAGFLLIHRQGLLVFYPLKFPQNPRKSRKPINTLNINNLQH